MRKIARLSLWMLALGPTVTAAEPVSLGWHWTPGRVLRYQTTQQQMQRLITGDDAVSGQHEQVVTWRLEVESTMPDGSAQLQVTYEHVRMTVDSPATGLLTYDSSIDAGERELHPLLRPVAQLSGRSLRLLVEDSGRIRKVEGADEVIRNMRGNPSAPESPIWAEALSQDVLAQQFETMFRVIPTHPVEVGDRWSRMTQQPGPGSGGAQVIADYRLSGMEVVGGEPCARIGFRMRGLPSDTETSGTIVFGIESGALREQTVFSRFVLSLAAPETPGDAVRQEVTQRIHFERVDRGE